MNRLAELRRRAALARRPGQPIVAGPRKKARYEETLIKKGAKLAAKALEPDVEDLLEQVRKATSFEDARRRILVEYRTSMHPRKLAEVIRKTNLLAHLSGMGAATDEVVR